MTGLLDHGVFYEELEQRIAAAATFSVVLLDIDDFKQINDRHGHQTGDGALRLVADALRAGIRSEDTVFRIGGEEFCAVLPGLSERDAFSVAEAMRGNVSAIVAALPNPVTVSVGVASFPAHGDSRDALVASADAALYASKRAGKNCTTIAGELDREQPPTRRRGSGLGPEQPQDGATAGRSFRLGILTVRIARRRGWPSRRR